jgi:hypothetical protein
MSKGDKPITACDFLAKLCVIWKVSGPWHLVVLGWLAVAPCTLSRVYYDSLNGNMTFKIYTQTHVHVWIHLLNLPQEYLKATIVV